MENCEEAQMGSNLCDSDAVLEVEIDLREPEVTGKAAAPRSQAMTFESRTNLQKLCREGTIHLVSQHVQRKLRRWGLKNQQLNRKAVKETKGNTQPGIAKK